MALIDHVVRRLAIMQPFGWQRQLLRGRNSPNGAARIAADRRHRERGVDGAAGFSAFIRSIPEKAN
jgi:hypothetical protein